VDVCLTGVYDTFQANSTADRVDVIDIQRNSSVSFTRSRRLIVPARARPTVRLRRQPLLGWRTLIAVVTFTIAALSPKEEGQATARHARRGEC
jgi:hypothetical protein